MELSILYLEGVVCQIVYKMVHIVNKVDYFFILRVMFTNIHY